MKNDKQPKMIVWRDGGQRLVEPVPKRTVGRGKSAPWWKVWGEAAGYFVVAVGGVLFMWGFFYGMLALGG